MKNKKGFTLIEGLICLIILGIVLSIVIPNVKRALKKSKNKARNVQVQEIVEKIRSEKISISEVGEISDITIYIIKDLKTGNEYFLSKIVDTFNDIGGVAMVKMDATKVKTEE